MNLCSGLLGQMQKKRKFVYELPENVVEVHEVFLDDALQVKEKGKMSHIFPKKN